MATVLSPTGRRTGRPLLALPLLLGLATLIADRASGAPLSGANADLDKVCVVQGGTYTDRTGEARSATTNDVTLGAEVGGTGSDAVFFGMEEPFHTLLINVGTAGTLGVQTWYYWSTTLGTWALLPVTDNTLSFTASGTNTVTWTVPSDWGETVVDATGCGGSRYYVRSLTTTLYLLTIPKATQVSAIEFNLRLQLQDELGTPFTGLAQNAFTVGGGTSNTVFAFRELGAGRYELALDAAGADVDFEVRASKDGYVTSAALATGPLSTVMTDRTGSPLSLSYAYKVTSVGHEAGGTLSSVTIATGDALGVACTESSGSWYCPVPVAHTGVALRAAKDGYVTKNVDAAFTDRTTADDAQRAAAISDVRFAVKITGVTTEIGSLLSLVTVSTGDSFGVACTKATGSWYCAVPLAHTQTSVRAVKDGYVVRTLADAFVDRTSATDAQRTAAVGDVRFAYKVTGVADELGEALASVTVAAGDGFGVACTESAGAWYCPVPLADTGLAIRASKDGFVASTSQSFASDRTAATDAQVAASVTGLAYAFKVAGITSEAGASLASAAVATGDGFGTSCRESSGAWYCAVPLTDVDVAIRVVKTGFVTHSASSFASDRTSDDDAQRTGAVTGLLYTLKILLETESSLTGVTLDRSVGTGSFGSVAADATVGNVAYFAQDPAQTELVYRATKYGVSVASGAAFAVSSASQTVKTLSLTASLTSVSAAAGSLAVSATTTYTFAFTTAHEWASNGRLTVTFPAGYSFGAVSAALTGAAGAATAGVAGQVVTITRAGDGAATSGGTSVALALTQITNPSGGGTTGTFSIALRSAADVVLDSGAAPAVSLVAPSAPAASGGTPIIFQDPKITSLTSSTHTSGVWSSSNTLTVSWGSDMVAYGYSWALDAEPDAISDSVQASATLENVPDGIHTFRVKALSYYSRWGPSAALPDLRIDTRAPSTVVRVAAESPARMELGFESVDQGVGVGRVELYVAENEGPYALFHSSDTANGSVLFSGKPDARYAFYGLGTDRLGHREATATAPIARAVVRGADLTASDRAMQILQGLVEGRLTLPVVAKDLDADGRAETFLDANARLVEVHRYADGEGYRFLLLGDAGRVALWNPTADRVDLLRLLSPSDVRVEEGPDGRLVLRADFETTDEAVVSLPDPAPGRSLERIVRTDGSEVPSHEAWRQDGRVFFVDAPSGGYEVHFSSYGVEAMGPRLPLPGLLGGAALLVSGVGALLWSWPTPDAPRGRRASFFFCGACGSSLARAARVIRSLHTCRPGAVRLPARSLASEMRRAMRPPRFEKRRPLAFEPVEPDEGTAGVRGR